MDEANENKIDTSNGFSEVSLQTSIFDETIDDKETQFWDELIKKYLFQEKPTQEEKV